MRATGHEHMCLHVFEVQEKIKLLPIIYIFLSNITDFATTPKFRTT